MYAATAITVFNGRTDKANRREVFTPTKISGASYLESKGSGHSHGVTGEMLQYKLRIPFTSVVQDGRIYVGETVYKTLADDEVANFWTLRKGDYIMTTQADDIPETVTQQELDALAKRLCADLIRVVEYADNTVRGSEAVKHWRVGGA